jgi:hypothetical protein
MPSHPDPLAEQTVGVPTQPPADGPAEPAQQYAAPPQDETGAQYGAQYAAPPQYAAQETTQHPYPPSGLPFASQYDAPPGYPTQPTAPRVRGDRGALVAACLAFLVVALGAPAVVLAWRSAVGPGIVPSGLVGGVLAVTGLSVLAVGLFPLVTSRGDAPPETGPAALFRAPVLLALIGAILLVGAAIAV